MSRPDAEVAHLFRQLKAPAAARALPKLAERARSEDWSFEKFAATLLSDVRTRGRVGARRSRGRAAGLDECQLLNRMFSRVWATGF